MKVWRQISKVICASDLRFGPGVSDIAVQKKEGMEHGPASKTMH